MFERLKEDIRTIVERDPAARSAAEVLFCYPGLHALAFHRAAHWCWLQGWTGFARWISHVGRFLTGIEIHPGARIGRRVFIDHGMGVVIGETTIIGDNCLLYQGVTLGGTGKDKGKRHPTLGDNVMVGAGAKVLGPINIGNNVKVAANAVVLKDIPDNCTAVGVPARIARMAGQKVQQQDLDQIHIPDLTMEDITMLKSAVTCLRAEMSKLESQEKKEKQESEN